MQATEDKSKLMTGFIKTQIKDKIARVTIDRPEMRNAFNDEMIIELTNAFYDLGSNPEVKVIILESTGDTFSAGADLNWMKSTIDYSYEENKADAGRLAVMLSSIHKCPKPVIGRIHGASFGGGVGLTCACDIVAATENAFFSLSEVKLGLIPAVISPFVLKKMPRAYAQRYFLTAEKITASKAKEIGFVAEVCKDTDELDQTIDSWIKEILKNGPIAVGLAKKLIEDTYGLELGTAIDHSTSAIAAVRASKEGQEGMRAFLEKRKPNWMND